MDFHFITFSFISGCFTAHVINQPKLVQQAQFGDSETMECFFLKKDFNFIVWYKQLLGKKPQPIAKSYYMNNVYFLKGFDDGRLSVTVGNGTYHLNIFQMTQEDVATYCGVIKFTAMYFSPGTFLMITGKYYLIVLLHCFKLIQSVVQQK